MARVSSHCRFKEEVSIYKIVWLPTENVLAQNTKQRFPFCFGQCPKKCLFFISHHYFNGVIVDHFFKGLSATSVKDPFVKQLAARLCHFGSNLVSLQAPSSEPGSDITVPPSDTCSLLRLTILVTLVEEDTDFCLVAILGPTV